MSWLIDHIATVVVDAFNALLAALVAAVNLLIDAWPINMPTLPTIPPEVLEAFGWLQWGPLGIVTAACTSVFTFMVSVWVISIVARPILRWAKVWE